MFRVSDAPATPARAAVRGGQPVATSPHRYLGGLTNDPFDEWIILYNDSDSIAHTTAVFSTSTGEQVPRYLELQPRSRTSLRVRDILPNTDQSATIQSDQQVYAVRSMFFRNGSAAAVAPSTASQTWYYAEGATGAGFDTWLLVQNPK